MFRGFLVLALGFAPVAMGCEQSTIVGECAVPDEHAITIAAPSNVPCNDHGDCELDECVPLTSPQASFVGACWSDGFRGCHEVAFEAWVVDAFCPGRRLEVCQAQLDADADARCDPPTDSLAPWIANFQCCDP
jgi:hypothetical protein